MADDSRWCAGVPAAESEVACGGAVHHLRWDAGRFAAVDHPDAEAENVLVVLGAAVPACLTYTRAWATHHTNLTVLELSRRHDGDTITVTGEQISELEALPNCDTVTADLFRLFTLPPGMVDRLVLTVLATWASSWTGPVPRDQRPALVAHTEGRAVHALRAWHASHVDCEVDIGPPTVDLDRTTNRLRAVLPERWLAEVWAKRLTVVDDHFLTEIDEISDTHARAQAVPTPGDSPVAIELVREPSGWHVRR